ncbi:MAG: PSD1 and planctomycete cytochrome C domain-containing protein [Planctomycetes bacterium]|nr:PSD1 and planctomycete cytochrome C domain-containing protein [Planctomycetota bacterium]
MSRFALASIALALGWNSPALAQPTKGTGFADKPTQDQLAFFEKKIRPVLVESCYNCHSAQAEKVKGELLLDTREGIRKGGATGPSIIPGNVERSPLIKGLRHKDPDTAMPPKAKLPDAVIADFEAWVKMGAPDPRDGKAVASNKYVVDVEKGRSFWAFVAPKKSPAPEVKNAAWATSDIDRHLLADLEKKGIKPVGDADKRTLLRRVYLDLTGLPPTSEEMEAFVADAAPNAFEKAVDKLLASPRFGERWGRHWLDIARYAESTGKTANFNYPHAWRYRDYVIAAFNADKPYDQFIKEQLAGDLMPSADPKTKAERIVATGFLAIGPKALNENSSLQFELDIVDEQIDVTTQAFLGITAACARCHDHKFDPIPTKDYYALAGIFRSTETCYGTVRFVQSQRPSPLIALPAESAPSAIAKKLTAEERTATEKEIADLKKKIAESTDRLANIFPAAQLSMAQSKLDSYEADGTPKLQAMGARDKPERGGGFTPKGPFGPGGFGPKGGFGMSRSIDDSPIYTRGEPNQPTAEKVARGTLQVMSKTPLKIKTGSGRLELAQWIASKDNPLTARVMANRVWMHLFGRGIVSTAENFGAAGQPPSNPELLDHLAISFMEDWSVKKLVKRIVMSHAYQLDSKFDKAAFEVDPDNALIWRMSPRRLDAESLRDSMLAVSGQLDATPPVGSVVARTGEGPVGRPRLGGDGISQAINDPKNTHRSVYMPIVRDNLPEALALFDAPDPSLITADRPTTTVPSQGLFILNNPFVIRSSEAVADKLLKSTTTETERIRAAYLTFYGRAPGEKELATAEKFLKGFQAQLAKDRVPATRQERETWAAFCQALFASAEFQYRK